MSYQTISRDGNMSLQYGRGIQHGAGINPVIWAQKFREKGLTSATLTAMYNNSVSKGLGAQKQDDAMKDWIAAMRKLGFTETQAKRFDLDGGEANRIEAEMSKLAAIPDAQANDADSSWLPSVADLTKYIPSVPSLGYASKPGKTDAPEPPPIAPVPTTVNLATSAPFAAELTPLPTATVPDPPVPDPPGVSVIQRAKNELEGASPMERIRLLEVLQASPGIQELVKAGLFKWQDIMKPNPTGPEHVSNPDGADPAMVIDAASLDKLQTALLQYAQQQQTTKSIDIQRYAQQTSTAGIKPGTGFYPGRPVYTYPRHIPGSLPNQTNVGWTGNSFTKTN